jgi:hypothetical protein
MTLDEYKSWYKEQYGMKPTEKLIERFIELNTKKSEVVEDKNPKGKKK